MTGRKQRKGRRASKSSCVGDQINGEGHPHIITDPLNMTPNPAPSNQSACSQDALMAKVKDEPPDWTLLQQENRSGISSCAQIGDNLSVGMGPGTPTPPQTIKQEVTECSPAKPTGKGRSSPSKTANGAVKQEKMTDSMPQKKKRDRFNGMSEDEVMKRTLPDHLREGLDIVIVGINPGLTAAYVGHHYAGPGNHFWKCLYLSGLIPEPMNAYDDYKLQDLGIGFTNIVERCSRGSADLTRKEIKEGADILREKISKFKPKIAVFNGKGIYEIFCGHKNFYIGRQPEPFPGTDTAVFVMPSSSARCSQLPRAVDKVPFYVAVKKLRDYLKGSVKELNDSEVVFPDLELKVEPRKDRLEGGVKTEKKKSAAKRKKKDTAANGATEGMFNQMGSPLQGAWPNGSMPLPPGGMVPPTSQVPSMDTIFNGTPSLVKQENTHDLANYGLFPSPPQFDNPAFTNQGGFNNSDWSAANGYPPITSQQHMTLANSTAASSSAGDFPMFSYAAMNYQNNQGFNSSPAFLNHPANSSANPNQQPQQLQQQQHLQQQQQQQLQQQQLQPQQHNFQNFSHFNGNASGSQGGYMGGFIPPTAP